MNRLRKVLAGALAAAVLAACHSGTSSTSSQSTTTNTGGSAQDAADSITRAVYNDDYAGVTANMDNTLRPKVGRAQVGTISDKMHKLGEYRGLSLLSTDAAKNEFTYRAQFAKGNVNVAVRLDSDGKVAAYHAFIPVHS